jgi:hypothetical protein
MALFFVDGVRYSTNHQGFVVAGEISIPPKKTSSFEDSLPQSIDRHQEASPGCRFFLFSLMASQKLTNCCIAAIALTAST